MKQIFSKKLQIVHKIEVGDTNFGRQPHIHVISYLYGLTLVIILGLLVLFFRLFHLTVVKGNYYKRLSEENRIHEVVVEAQRGSILDRKGFVIAFNKPGNVHKNSPRIVSSRTYKTQEEVAHVVGYRQVADALDIKNDTCVNKLKLGDKVGKKGVEELYDCNLRGVAGKKLVETDAHGTYLRTISIIPPVDGEEVRLSIDLMLQKKAYDLIKNQKAVVIGLDPSTGQTLIYASSPSFNPQYFEDGNKQLSEYFTDKNKPLFDRITQGTYPPGSIFKLFVATGLLEERKMKPNDIVQDDGFIRAGPITFGNWYYLQYGKTEGPVDLLKAIRRSNDIYFYKAGEALGAEGIKKWASIFGLNNKANIGFTESESVLPSPFWKSEVLKERWYLGDTYNTSIGQGYTLVTPLQMAKAVLPFANGGSLCVPTLLKNAQPSCKKLSISQETLKLIRAGMRETCTTGGTGWPLFNFGVKISPFGSVNNQLKSVDTKTATDSSDFNRFQPISTGCKTGTAESHAKSGVPHAWFTVFAPFEKPEIALTVLVEEGGQGSDVAAPIARDILRAYFERKE